MFIDLLDYFDTSNSQIALIGSLFMGVSLCGGPVVCGVMHAFGIRRIALVGAVVLFVTLCLSSHATSAEFLVVSYGIVGGKYNANLLSTL